VLLLLGAPQQQSLTVATDVGSLMACVFCQKLGHWRLATLYYLHCVQAVAAWLLTGWARGPTVHYFGDSITNTVT
jgi:hypothetical protein